MIKGSIIAGSNTGSGTLTRSGSVRSENNIGTIIVKQNLVGNASNPVIISGRGQAVQSAHKDVAIRRLVVQGDVTYANILAGYDVNGNPVDGSARRFLSAYP